MNRRRGRWPDFTRPMRSFRVFSFMPTLCNGMAEDGNMDGVRSGSDPDLTLIWHDSDPEVTRGREETAVAGGARAVRCDVAAHLHRADGGLGTLRAARRAGPHGCRPGEGGGAARVRTEKARGGGPCASSCGKAPPCSIRTSRRVPRTTTARASSMSPRGLGSGGNLVPVLAAEIPSLAAGTVSRDGRWIIWKLKQGVTWHDGKPFTADDVAFTAQYAIDPRRPRPRRASTRTCASTGSTRTRCA